MADFFIAEHPVTMGEYLEFLKRRSENWRGRPLVSHEVIVNLIANTTTRTGLRVQAALDTGCYPKGRKITEEQMATINLDRAEFHGDWNYTIKPRSRQTDKKTAS